ncbi:fibrous sheath-interacting protein 1 isoform X2 [Paramormyrops kingsleyae]|uniref:fibrous sheath-interacting protein 1 isoform X2 n=1 Tax=Paramormyrops kingsleyae TaxID=1676925 RepID=UPI000CD5FFF2|nr:fibrous sheath-interacting protein 1 isoform X2 [Paramormyrops kingsleyae]
MDITKGSLDDISRPASSERPRPGSRVSLREGVRVNQDTPYGLAVLSPDSAGTETPNYGQKGAPDNEFPVSSEDQAWLDGMDLFHGEEDEGRQLDQLGRHSSESEGKSGDFYTEESDEENKTPVLQEAIRKMKKLDKILAQKISKEKAVKAMGKELQVKMWKELKDLRTKPERADEAENTRLYLALGSTSSYGPSEDGDFVPIFGTQISQDGYDVEEKNLDEGNGVQCKATDCIEFDLEEPVPDRPDCRRSGVVGAKRKKDFVKKNIELVRDAGSQVLMTQAEKQRLAELLQDLEECNTSPEGDEVDPTLWAVHVPAGEGYTPEPAELDQLHYIDSRLSQILPVEGFLSVCSPYFCCSSSKGRGAGRSHGDEQLPGEKVLQDIRETRGQEVRLKEIEEQLERLGHEQESTLGSPPLLEEQLRTLLEDCMLSLRSASVCGSVEGNASPRAASDGPSRRLSTDSF